ncbi:hypothetical protein ACFDTO_22780 [Microbacteriaceae bacterium 4G12]
MQTLTAEHVFNINKLEYPKDSYGIFTDYNSNLIMLTATKRSEKYDYVIYHITKEGVKTIALPSVKESFHNAQLLGENWLLVNARVSNNTDHNAFIYKEDGSIITSFHIGDGIEHVQVTENGDIWVGYFDEGIYGHTELAQSGLNCFNQKGELTFEFFLSDDVPIIDACYALNAATNEEVYTYYYTDFPLVQIKNKREYKVFQNFSIEGCRAFAVWKEHVLFGHGYKDKGLIHLYSTKNKSTVTYTPVNKQGDVLTYDFAIGRKHNLFLISNQDIYCINMMSENF